MQKKTLSILAITKPLRQFRSGIMAYLFKSTKLPVLRWFAHKLAQRSAKFAYWMRVREITSSGKLPPVEIPIADTSCGISEQDHNYYLALCGEAQRYADQFLKQIKQSKQD